MEAISIFDIFKVGVGPSSSHTMGPWRAAQQFLTKCRTQGLTDRIEGVRVDLFGSLAKTGKGHGTDMAVILGLSGGGPTRCETTSIQDRIAAITACQSVKLEGVRAIKFDPQTQIVFHMDTTLPFHSNGI